MVIVSVVLYYDSGDAKTPSDLFHGWIRDLSEKNGQLIKDNKKDQS